MAELELKKKQINLPYRPMIEKIEILQHGECRYLGSHPREDARRLLGIIAYHHEMVIQLRKDSLNSLSEAFFRSKRAVSSSSGSAYTAHQG